MIRTHAGAWVLGITLVLGAGSLAACSSSTTTSTDASAAPAAADTAAATAAADSGTSYCDPLKAAFEVKPPSGEAVTPEQTAAFGAAMEPVAEAAKADGNAQLAEVFALIAKVNTDGDAATSADTSNALAGTIAVADEVKAACGVDLLA